jgi:hypothetical protein
MSLRYPAAAAVTLAALISAPGVAAKVANRHVVPASPPPVPVLKELYSQRALRRARIILQLKLMELREQRLERVRKAIERRIPIDQLLNGD